MKFSTRLVLATLILMFAAPVLAGKGARADCKLLGSWIGYDAGGSAWWMSTADGQNASRGTLNLEVPGSVLFFSPPATSVTELRGVWEKTGKKTYDWTVVGFPYDEVAATVVLAKLSGKDTVSEDCNTLYVTDVVMEVFEADADLNSDTPISIETFLPHEGHRIMLDLPELP